MAATRKTGKARELADRVKDFIQANHLCGPNDRVLVACSGGPDSTALLDLMRKLAPGLGFSLGVIHIDHGQYPESEQAARKVSRRCRRWGLDFTATSVAGPHLPPGSSEAALREARTRALREAADSRGYTLIATGHTESDQVETVLMRILRGTTTAGLAGIPVRRDLFIRPLLCCAREEIISYLKSRRISFHQDPTNLSRRYLRNRIRHDLLEMIRRQVNPAVDQAILRLSNSASRDNHLLTQMAHGMQPQTTADDAVELPIAMLSNLHDAVLSRVLIHMLQTLCQPGANLEQQHVERILSAIRSSCSRSRFSLDLPGGVQAYLAGDNFGLRRTSLTAQAGFHLTVERPSEISLPQNGTRLRFAVQNIFDPGLASSRHVFFDARRVPFPLVVRSVTPGDRLNPWGVKGSRKVARMLLDAKIPRQARALVPLLVWRDRVLWVAGLRRSDWAPVIKGTDQVLSVELLDAPVSG